MAGKAGEGSQRSVRRKDIPDKEWFALWIRSGGRCAICNTYLLDEGMTYRTIRLGEAAHIVGQQQTAGSPRGDADLAPELRDKADNLILLCRHQHKEIDSPEGRDLFPVDRLKALKHSHEDRIRHVTGLGGDRATTVIRLIGKLRGNEVELSRPTAAATVITSAERYPWFLECYSRHGFEIDLRHVPGEAEAGTAYYAAATQAIDRVIDHRLNDGIARDEITHLSVFGFARIPLLVYFGARLDDNVPTDIYQRHRADGSWTWSSDAPLAQFETGLVNDTPAGSEAVLVLNLSGTIQPTEIPANLAALRTYSIAPTNVQPGQDILRNKASLDAYVVTLRKFFSEIEAHTKSTRRLHVLAAVPVSAAITLGQVRIPEVNPSFVLYDRTESSDYKVALEIL